MMVDVTVKVPEELVGDVYAAVGRLLSGTQDREALQVATDETASLKPWGNTAGDIAAAREVWGKLSPNAVALFSSLMDHPGESISGEDLAAQVSIPNGKYGIAGVLAWPGRHCAAANRPPFWEFAYGPAGGSADYWVEDEVAQLFNKVR
jgi:hypothetical protein